jgi:aspartate/methionine/tyrosine aminotransferase
MLVQKYETSIVPGRFFEMPEHFRVGIGGETASLEEGLRRLGLALDDLRNSGAG